MKAFTRAALVGLFFLVAATISRLLPNAASGALPVWFGSGVVFAALVASPRRSWSSLLIGAGVASGLWALVVLRFGWGDSLVFALTKALPMGAAAWVASAGRADPKGPTGAGLLLTGVALGSVLGAGLSVALGSWHRPDLGPVVEFRNGSISTAVGMLLLAPVVVAFSDFRVRRSGGMTMPVFLGGAAAFAAFLVFGLAVFSNGLAPRLGSAAAPLAYVPMPFLLIASLVWGSRGGSLATLAGCLLILLRTMQGQGPFTLSDDFQGESVIEAQVFVLVWASVFLLARGLSHGHRRALADASDWRLRYERALQSGGTATVELDVSDGSVVWGQNATTLLGPDFAAAVTIDAWLEHIEPIERAGVRARWTAVASGERDASEHEYAARLSDGRLVRVHERLAAVRGGDDRVEQVAGLLSVLPAGAWRG